MISPPYLRLLHEGGVFPEYITYKIKSFPERKVEVKPASDQYTDYLFCLTLLSHASL